MALSGHVRPLTDSMPLAYSHDPDFDRAPFAAGPDGTALDEESAEKAFMVAFLSCRERHDYAGVTKAGGQPTIFHCRPLTDDEVRRMRGLAVSDAQLAALVVRICLERVENGGALDKLERKVDPDYPGFGKLVTVKYMDLLGNVSIALGRMQGDITNELGNHVFSRSINLDPKS